MPINLREVITKEVFVGRGCLICKYGNKPRNTEPCFSCSSSKYMNFGETNNFKLGTKSERVLGLLQGAIDRYYGLEKRKGSEIPWINQHFKMYGEDESHLAISNYKDKAVECCCNFKKEGKNNGNNM